MPIVTRFRDVYGDEFFIDDYGALSVVDEFDTPSALVTKEGLPEFVEWLKTQVEQSDGWIKWDGGECPVESDWLVSIKFRDGDTYPPETGMHVLFWEHVGNNGDIIAYRVVKPTK